MLQHYMLTQQLNPKVRWDSIHPPAYTPPLNSIWRHWPLDASAWTSRKHLKQESPKPRFGFSSSKEMNGPKRKRLVFAGNFLPLSMESHVEGRDGGREGKSLTGRWRNRTWLTETLEVLRRDGWEAIFWGSGKVSSIAWPSAVGLTILQTPVPGTQEPPRVPVHHGEESCSAWIVLASGPSPCSFRSDFSAAHQIALSVAF